MPPKRPRRSSITLPVKRPRTTHPHPHPRPRADDRDDRDDDDDEQQPPHHRHTSAPLPRPAPFPPSGATAYTSVSGPLRAATLPALAALRLLPDYESCNPSLTDAQLRADHDYSRAARPRGPDEPLRVPQPDIDAEWDMYRLRALLAGTREDIDALNGLLVGVEREVHDLDREIEDARRREGGGGGGRWMGRLIEFWAPRMDGYGRWRCLQISTGKYEVDLDWDVVMLQDVFSAAQRDVDRLLGTLRRLEKEVKDKRRLVSDLKRQFGVTTSKRE